VTDDLARLEEAAQTAKDNRDDQKATYDANKADLESTISAVKEAMKALVDTQGSKDLLQLDASVSSQLLKMPLVLMSLSDDQQALLEHDAGEDGDDNPLAGKAPEKKAYTFKTGAVTDLLKGLRNDFEDKLHTTEMEEMQNKNEYDLSKGASDENIKIATALKAEKTKIEGETKSDKTKLENTLESTESDLKADSESLSTTTATCKVRANEMTERRYQRQREQEAMAYGVKILSKAEGIRSKPPSPPPAFFQLRSQSAAEGKTKKIEVVQDLRKQAEKMHSSELRRLAMQVEAHMADAPIGKTVHQIIEKQTSKLKVDQQKDDEKQIWCDTQVDKTTKDIKHKEDEMDSLTNEIEAGTSTVDEYSKKIKELKEKISEIDAENHEEKMDRQETSHENQLAIKDSQDGQKAVADAIKVLEKFYKDAAQAAESSAFIQEPAEVAKAPDMPDGGFTGTSEEGKAPGQAIIELLEKTQTDYAKMEADVKAQDAADKQAFEKKMQANKVEKAKATTEVENKEQENSRLNEQIESWTNDFKQTDRAKSLLGVKLEDLNKECVEETYKARKEARTMEIDGLKQADEKLATAFEYETAALAAAPIAKPVQVAAPAPVAKVQPVPVQPQPAQQKVQPTQPPAMIQESESADRPAASAAQELPFASFLSP